LGAGTAGFGARFEAGDVSAGLLRGRHAHCEALSGLKIGWFATSMPRAFSIVLLGLLSTTWCTGIDMADSQVLASLLRAPVIAGALAVAGRKLTRDRELLLERRAATETAGEARATNLAAALSRATRDRQLAEVKYHECVSIERAAAANVDAHT